VLRVSLTAAHVSASAKGAASGIRMPLSRRCVVHAQAVDAGVQDRLQGRAPERGDALSGGGLRRAPRLGAARAVAAAARAQWGQRGAAGRCW
jgi:hypothetical protein